MAHRRVRVRFVGGMAAAILAVLGLGAGVAVAADNPVAISGFSFSPRNITVSVGDSVTWTNSDAQAHTATADDSSFDTGAIANNASKTVTFATAGVFAYHCSIHAAMTGTITVQGAAAAANPPTDTDPVVGPGSSGGVAGAALLVAAAGLVGFVVARRRFSRA